QKAPEDMKLFFLKNPLDTCNDGTRAGYYLREHEGSKIFLLAFSGGWCCYSKETCDTRYKNIWRLMSSSGPEAERAGWGQLASSATQTAQHPSPPALRASQSMQRGALECALWRSSCNFKGSGTTAPLCISIGGPGHSLKEVFLLTSISAGGTGMLLDLERVVTLLEMLGAEAVQVRGLVDLGWFLDLKHPRQSDCSDAASSAPADAIKKGLRMWKRILLEKCKLKFKRVDEWQCFLGYRLYSSLKSPVFVVQWVFDKEQLRLENIHLGSQSLTEIQWNYLKNLGRELSNSQCAVSAVFAPACLSHMLITKSYWLEFQVKGISLARALQCWEKSLQSSNKAPKICMRSCPFHLIDNCPWPYCNPTCSALHDHGIGHEVNFQLALFRMRPDVHSQGKEHGLPTQVQRVTQSGV
uniref:Uncharacterized protein n=1 Tax=Pelodiscus sinensis TaxID=13735 RepID=K7F8R7_PELSI